MNSANLSPEEKRAAEARVLREDPEGARLSQAMIELNMDTWVDQRRNSDEAADLFTCVLHGALDLNQQQYSQIDALLKNYYRMAGVKLLSLHDMSLAGATDDRSPSGRLDLNTLRQIQNLLTAAQKEDFQQLAKPQK
jgi:hypothetical protein